MYNESRTDDYHKMLHNNIYFSTVFSIRATYIYTYTTCTFVLCLLHIQASNWFGWTVTDNLFLPPTLVLKSIILGVSLSGTPRGNAEHCVPPEPKKKAVDRSSNQEHMQRNKLGFTVELQVHVQPTLMKDHSSLNTTFFWDRFHSYSYVNEPAAKVITSL